MTDESQYNMDAQKDSRCCKVQLVSMDIIHALYNTVLLIVCTNNEKFPTSDSFWWYDVFATALSYQGIFFNIFIRSLWGLALIDKMLAYCTTFRCLKLSEARREWYINIGSWFPTLMMTVVGQAVIWSNDTDELSKDPLGVSAWITAWLYTTVKMYGFTRYIYDLRMHYNLKCQC